MTRIFDASGSTRPTGWSVSRTVSDRSGASQVDVAIQRTAAGLYKRATYGKERITYSQAGALLGLIIEPGAVNRSDGGYQPTGGTGIGAGGYADPFGTNGATQMSNGSNNYQFLDYVAGGTQFIALIKATAGNSQVFKFGCDRTSNQMQWSADTGALVYSGTARDGVVLPGPNGFTYLSFVCDQPAGNSSISITMTGGTGNAWWSLLCAQDPISPRHTPIIAKNASSPVSLGPDVVKLTLGSDVTALTFTFDDNSTQIITGLTPGAVYTVPTNLNRQHVLYIDDNGTAGDGVYVPPPGRLATPLDLATKPLYFFDPSQGDLNSFDSSGKLLQRKNAAGGSLVAACPDSNTARRPSIAQGAIGGRDAVGYDGINAYERCLGMAFTGNAFTAFAVVQPSGSSGYSRFMSFGNVGTNDYNNMQSCDVEQGNGNGKIHAVRNGNISPEAAFTNLIPILLEFAFDGTTGYFWINGNLIGSTASSGAFNIAAASFGISMTGADGFKGQQGAQLFYPVFLSAADRAFIRGSLAWRWDGDTNGPLVGGMPANDPYKTAAPRVVDAVTARRRPVIVSMSF